MVRSLSSRTGRLCAIVSAGLWLGGIVLLCAVVRPAPCSLAATILSNYLLGWGITLVLAAPPRLRVIARFTLTTVALALPLGCLELLSVVGIADFRTLFVATGLDPGHNPDNTPDRELIHIHKPYLKRAGKTRGDIASVLHMTDAPLHPYEVAYDRQGFRNPRDLSEAEVAVLGDSFVEGGLVTAGDLMTATLGRILGCNVANLGQSAYGPQQELVVLNRYAAPLRPRLCIWTFYEGNDLDDVARYVQLTQGDSRSVRSTPLDRSFGRNTLLALSSALGRIFAPVAIDQAPSGTYQDVNGRATRLFFRDRGLLLPHQELSALDEVISVLTVAHSVCAANRMRLLFVFLPQKFRVYKNYCSFTADNPCSRWVLDNLPERLRARVAAIDPGIGFLDLTPALTAEAAQGRLLYFADDTHWSAEGHRVAGRTIAADITQRIAQGSLPPMSPQREKLLASKKNEPQLQ